MNIALSVAYVSKLKTTLEGKRATTSIFDFQSENRRKCLNSLTDRGWKSEIPASKCRTSGASISPGFLAKTPRFSRKKSIVLNELIFNDQPEQGTHHWPTFLGIF
jgi:hypothetical protein